MEFNEKLQELRKRKGLTQEELAQALYVSRTAISKWEAGRGYPNIDSLKAIAKFFGVTIDDLLCGDELLSLAEEDQKQKEIHLRDLVFGLLDCSAAIFFFLPFFAQKTENIIQEVSLFALHQVPAYLKAAFYIAVIGVVAWGVLTLALQNWKQPVWVRNKSKISLIIGMLAALLFIVSLQPYAAVLMFLSLTIKVIMLIKWQ